ncbi:MAG: hypothetical protein M3387_06185 [Actinomycetota bacterium]|nr:hypothetical protein [Actinomycetota bacterium]
MPVGKNIMIRATLAAVLVAATIFAGADPPVPAVAAPMGNVGRPDVGRHWRRVGIELNQVGRYTAVGADFNDGGAEIVAYDSTTQRLFVANGSETTVDVIDVSEPSNPQLVGQVDVTSYGDGVNGVGAVDGLVGVAISPEDAQNERGSAVFLNAPKSRGCQGGRGRLPTRRPALRSRR